jgi:hypothetical protein
LLIIAYVFSSTKLEKREEQVLAWKRGRWGRMRRGEVAQTMHAHMDK